MKTKKHPYITFGSDHLKNFDIKPEKVMLYIEGVYDENELRKQIFNTPSIGKYFSTSYPKEEWDTMQAKWNWEPIELKELLKLKKMSTEPASADEKKTYTFSYWEKVSVWKEYTCYVITNDIESVKEKVMKDHDFIDIDDFEETDRLPSDEGVLEYDFDGTTFEEV